MKKLGFGLMRLPLRDPRDSGSIDLEEVNRMVDLFLERGFTYFDTAYVYHNGMSEKIVREALVKRHPRDSFTLATKLPVFNLKSSEEQERIFAEELERCGVEYFDYYLLHNLGSQHYEIAQRMDSFAFVARKKREGRVKYAGFSFHDSAALLDEILTAHPEMDFVQLQINYLDWEDAGVQSRRCYEVAAGHGKPVIVMEPVKGGLLAAVPEQAELLLKGSRPDASVASWAVRYAASLENVMVVLSGMSNLEQVEDNTGYMRSFVPLTREEWELTEQAARIIRQATAIPCTGCGYCVKGCPAGIPIPRYFALYNAQRRRNGSVHRLYYDNAAKTQSRASDCIGCGQCVGACPQHIDVPGQLKKVAEEFEGD